jgi:hypothetical protein
MLDYAQGIYKDLRCNEAPDPPRTATVDSLALSPYCRKPNAKSTEQYHQRAIVLQARSTERVGLLGQSYIVATMRLVLHAPYTD